jgi:hypothetical protein
VPPAQHYFDLEGYILAKKRKDGGKGGSPANPAIRNITPKQIDQLVDQLKKRPERPIECILEDQGAVEGLITLLCVKEVVTLEEVQDYAGRYQSALTSLVMLCIDKGLFSEFEYHMAIVAFHETIRALGPGHDLTIVEMFEKRKEYYRAIVNRVTPPVTQAIDDIDSG